MLSKTCFKCSVKKPIECFYKHPRMKDGRLNKCIECAKVDVHKHRQKNIEQIQAYDRGRGTATHRVIAKILRQQKSTNKTSKAISSKKWQIANASRRKAQNILRNAVRDGKISPLPCFECGSKAQAHHPDYSAPLAVSWLCSWHHAQVHREHREMMRQTP